MFSLIQLEDVKVQGFKYMKRAGIFKGNNGNCVFNPETGVAHSYDWYRLADRINGVQVLNTFSYSNQTAKHRGKVADTMHQLGIQFIGIEAPRGLQNLDEAFVHLLSEYGDRTIELKYARIKSSSSRRHRRSWVLGQIENLKMVSLKHRNKFTKKALAVSVKAAEVRRRQRLDFAKTRRLKAKLASKPQVLAQIADVSIQGGV